MTLGIALFFSFSNFDYFTNYSQTMSPFVSIGHIATTPIKKTIHSLYFLILVYRTQGRK